VTAQDNTLIDGLALAPKHNSVNSSGICIAVLWVNWNGLNSR